VRLALDTNRYTDFCRGDERVVQVLETAEAIYVPFVVLGELGAGFSVGKHGAHNVCCASFY
jgi:predicted nucleic acid-binding protein